MVEVWQKGWKGGERSALGGREEGRKSGWWYRAETLRMGSDISIRGNWSCNDCNYQLPWRLDPGSKL